MRIIKSLPLIAVLFTCVVLLSSAAIFASEDGISSSEVPSHVSSYLAPDLDDVLAKSVAEEIYDKLSEGTRADATITDVYNILRYDILPGLKGSVSNSNYSLPRIAYDTRHGLFGTGTLESVSAWDLLYRLAPVNNLGTNQFPLVYSPAGSGLTYTQAELSGMTWARVGDILSNLNLTNSYLSAISNQISGYNWLSYNASYLGTSRSNDSNYLTATSWGSDFYVCYSLTSMYYTSPNILRFFVPIYANVNSQSGRPPLDIDFIYSNGSIADSSQFEYFVEGTANGSFVYLIDFNQRSTGRFVLHVTSSQDLVFRTDSGTVYYIPFNSDDYQQMKQAFYQAKSANAQGSMASDVNRLADYLADPDKIAAEQASQQVIDDTLDGFTGNGSAAAKTSDTGSMKNMSSSLQSGLDTGAGVSNATNVFSLNGGFWGWFTQSNSDLINNPYPAPVVNNNRKSSGDEVVDFLSDNQSQVMDLLGDSKW